MGSRYDDIRLHVARPYISSADIFDIILCFVQPSSLRYSSLPSPLYLHFHRPPSYVVFLSSHHIPIPLQPSFMDFLCDSPTFVVPLLLSFLILSSFVTPHIHRRILISATSNTFIFLCLLQRPCICPVHQCCSYHCSVHLPIDLHVNFPVAQYTPDTLFPFFHPICTLWVTSASSYPSSANVDTRYVNVFTLFNPSPCKWISAS